MELNKYGNDQKQMMKKNIEQLGPGNHSSRLNLGDRLAVEK
jgi:hypothetical protein